MVPNKHSEIGDTGISWITLGESSVSTTEIQFRRFERSLCDYTKFCIAISLQTRRHSLSRRMGHESLLIDPLGVAVKEYKHSELRIGMDRCVTRLPRDRRDFILGKKNSHVGEEVDLFEKFAGNLQHRRKSSECRIAAHHFLAD